MTSPVRVHAASRLAAALRRQCCLFSSVRPIRAATDATAASTSTADPPPPPYKRASRGGRRRRQSSSSASPSPPPPPSPARCPLPAPPPGAVDPPTYAARLDHKVSVLTDLLASVGALPPPATSPLAVYASPPAGYRARAEFRVWHEGDDVFFIMFDDRPGIAEPGRRPPKVRVEAYPVGSPLMGALMAGLLAAVRAEPGGDCGAAAAPLRSRLFQANFLTTTAGEAVLTLVYHRALDDAWKAAAEGLRDRLQRAAAAAAAAAGGAWAAGRVDVVGRSRGQRLDVRRNHATEVLAVGPGGPHGLSLTYRHVEGAFSQPNPAVCASMLAWAAATAAGEPPTDGGAARPALGSGRPPRPDDLLELYCGGGTFTAALAPCFRRTLATEVSRASVAAAAVNLAANGLGDGSGEGARVVVLRSDAADVAAVLANVDAAAAAGLESLPPPAPDADPPPMRIGGRAPGAVDPRAWDLRTLFVDPPRAGVGTGCATSLFPRFDRILYISCNPATLAADVAALTAEGGSHTPVAAALFDQFPYTDHIEAGLLLERRS